MTGHHLCIIVVTPEEHTCDLLNGHQGQYLSLNLDLVGLPGQSIPGILLPLPPSAERPQQALLHRCWRSNAGPHACTTNTLPTEPSPRTLNGLFSAPQPHPALHL